MTTTSSQNVVLAFALWLLTSLVAFNVHAADCEDTVDMADSLNFNKMHMECGKTKEAEETSKKQQTATTTDSTTKAAMSEAPETGNLLFAKEAFSLTGGPLSAETLLFQSMAQACPKGWEIIKQTVTLNGKNAEMQYQYICL